MPNDYSQLYHRLDSDRLGRLCELARRLVATSDQVAIHDLIAAETTAIMAADYGSIQLLEGEEDAAVTLERRPDWRKTDDARKCDQLVVGWVLNNETALLSSDLAADDRFPFVAGDASCRSAVVAVSIRFRADTIGVLIVARAVEQPFSEPDATLLELVGELVSAALHNIRRLRQMAQEVRDLKNQLAGQGDFAGLVGRSEAWNRVCETLNNVAPSEASILLLGESGTGKELCARAIHDMSDRRERPFIAVNCAALPESLAESELFGYIKGAFTGAAQDRDGLFVAADGGTLFLDEIGSASTQLQSSLLRAIQEGEIRPVGSTTARKVDVRLVCATSSDLEAMVDSGAFRKDLYFRVNVVSIRIPPLRDRREDIALLAREFLRRHARRYDRRIDTIAPEALVVLGKYPWPGNVRELQNAMEHALLFTPAQAEEVATAALPQSILTAVGEASLAAPTLTDEGLDGMVAHYEREIVRSTLESCNWNQSQTARALNVPESRIRERIKRYQLQPPEHSD